MTDNHIIFCLFLHWSDCGSAFSGAADCRSAARIRFHPDDRYNRNKFRFIGIKKKMKRKHGLTRLDSWKKNIRMNWNRKNSVIH